MKRSRDLRTAVTLTVALGCGIGAAVVLAQPAGSGGSPPAPAPGAAPPLPPGVAAPAPPPAPPSPNVKIVFTVVPSTRKAMVFWGKKKLGPIAPHQPLYIQRPRDSGPLDVIVKSDDCIPVQTRAYTFADSKVSVKLTPVAEKNTLLGYRDELPPEDGGVPAPGADGGAP
jgi:hypothetical protein